MTGGVRSSRYVKTDNARVRTKVRSEGDKGGRRERGFPLGWDVMRR